MGCSLISRLIIGLLKVWLNSEEFYLVLLIFFRGAKCVLGWDWARWRSSRRSDADGGEAGTVDAAPTAGYGRATSADWTNAELCDVQSPSVSIGCQCETTFMTVHSVHRNPRATVSLQLLFFFVHDRVFYRWRRCRRAARRRGRTDIFVANSGRQAARWGNARPRWRTRCRNRSNTARHVQESAFDFNRESIGFYCLFFFYLQIRGPRHDDSALRSLKNHFSNVFWIGQSWILGKWNRGILKNHL